MAGVRRKSRLGYSTPYATGNHQWAFELRPVCNSAELTAPMAAIECDDVPPGKAARFILTPARDEKSDPRPILFLHGGQIAVSRLSGDMFRLAQGLARRVTSIL